jgi:hypothetical protein
MAHEMTSTQNDNPPESIDSIIRRLNDDYGAGIGTVIELIVWLNKQGRKGSHLSRKQRNDLKRMALLPAIERLAREKSEFSKNRLRKEFGIGHARAGQLIDEMLQAGGLVEEKNSRGWNIYRTHKAPQQTPRPAQKGSEPFKLRADPQWRLPKAANDEKPIRGWLRAAAVALCVVGAAATAAIYQQPLPAKGVVGQWAAAQQETVTPMIVTIVPPVQARFAENALKAPAVPSQARARAVPTVADGSQGSTASSAPSETDYTAMVDALAKTPEGRAKIARAALQDGPETTKLEAEARTAPSRAKERGAVVRLMAKARDLFGHLAEAERTSPKGSELSATATGTEILTDRAASASLPSLDNEQASPAARKVNELARTAITGSGLHRNDAAFDRLKTDAAKALAAQAAPPGIPAGATEGTFQLADAFFKDMKAKKRARELNIVENYCDVGGFHDCLPLGKWTSDQLSKRHWDTQGANAEEAMQIVAYWQYHNIDGLSGYRKQTVTSPQMSRKKAAAAPAAGARFTPS